MARSRRSGIKFPIPPLIFVYLIVFVILLSTVLGIFGVGITEEMLVPADPEQVDVTYWGGTDAPVQEYPQGYTPDYVVQEVTTTIRPLLSIEGIRFAGDAGLPAGRGRPGAGLVAILSAGRMILVSQGGHSRIFDILEERRYRTDAR